MKKILIYTLILILICTFAGCTGVKTGSDGGKPSVVAVNFPAYDFARQVCGDRANVEMLLPPGSESHLYEPTTKDIIKIQSCDLFVYTGGESDEWLDDVLKSADFKADTVKMTDCVDTVVEELPEGADTHSDGSEEDYEYDEHVWTSPLNAIEIAKAISGKMIKIDKDGEETYKANTENFTRKLSELDHDFTECLSAVKNPVMVFGDRFPLRYFADRYGIKYYAAFPGCAAETEPSAATMVELQKAIKEQNVSTVYYIEFSNHNIADALAEATGTKTAQFNACHNVTKKQFEDGVTYIDLMRENISTLKKTLPSS